MLRGIVDVATQEVSLAFFLHESNRMVFVSTLSAEMNGIQVFIRVFW